MALRLCNFASDWLKFAVVVDGGWVVAGLLARNLAWFQSKALRLDAGLRQPSSPQPLRLVGSDARGSRAEGVNHMCG